MNALRKILPVESSVRSEEPTEEENTLISRKAKPAGLRAEDAEAAHIDSLKDTITDLRKEKAQLATEHKRLHSIEVEHRGYTISNRYSQLLLILGSIVWAGGGLLSRSGMEEAGVSAMVIGAIVQLFVGLFNPCRDSA